MSRHDLWRSVETDWTPLLDGSADNTPLRVEWHDFTPDHDFDWSPAIDPDRLLICLNLSGHGELSIGEQRLELGESTTGYLIPGDRPLMAYRRRSERHQFATVGFTREYVAPRVAAAPELWRAELRGFAEGRGLGTGLVSATARLTGALQHLAASLRQPPVPPKARRLWYEAKALEVAASTLFDEGVEGELFCQRHQRTSQERVIKTISILRENLAEPPALEELGRRVGCSPYYLSRMFSQEMGKTISAYLRDLRMERAAELLREGRANVTEAALSVGYSSLSHFSATFRETFGCCPGLYPIPVPSERPVETG